MLRQRKSGVFLFLFVLMVDVCSGPVSAGPKIKYLASLESCDLSFSECANLVAVASEEKMQVGSSLTAYIKTYFGDNCPNSCAPFGLRAGLGVASFNVDVMVFGHYRYGYDVSKSIDFWEEIPALGGCQ